MFAWIWLGAWCQIKETVHLNMTDANSSSGSAEQAENAINVNCLFKKYILSLKQIYCGEKGSECGERRPRVWGAPQSLGDFFSILN